MVIAMATITVIVIAALISGLNREMKREWLAEKWNRHPTQLRVPAP